MAINNDKTHKWKKDVILSVDFYNNWFLNFAPQAYRDARNTAIDRVDETLIATNNLSNITAEVLKTSPSSLGILRMATIPPLARDRLIGLSGVPSNLVKKMEEGILPNKVDTSILTENLRSIVSLIKKLLDTDIFDWLNNRESPDEVRRRRAASIIADRVCGAVADPIIRNAQEKRQLTTISEYLTNLGYHYIQAKDVNGFENIPAGYFSYHFNVPVNISIDKQVNIPVDVAIMRKNAKRGDFPILLECKSAGDFTNTNKRRKEEAIKIAQLRNTYGNNIEFILFLCGYFDSGYLGYEAAEGIDWIWEHRMDDFSILKV